MKTDVYTKTVLTVIAICLSLHLVKDFELIPSAIASENPSEVPTTTQYRLVPVSDLETIDVRIVDINTYDELNVNVKSIDTYDEMKVNIKNIDTSDELDINIDEVGGSGIYAGNALPVILKNN
ncbi:MAG: hypothetical protein R2786_06935 [Flavobacteriaceae bacterium]